jgi:hypothetical protein
MRAISRGRTDYERLPVSLNVNSLLFGKMTRVMGDMAGTADLPGFPYPMEQSAGAWIGLAVTAVWASRRYLADAAVG